jgi:endonuclease-3 related protein
LEICDWGLTQLRNQFNLPEPKTTDRMIVEEVYTRLFDHYGPQNWWPGDSPFEVIVGAVLTQNTAWSNVELAIDMLRAANCLSPEAMHHLPLDGLAELIRSAGYYRVKAKRLANLLNFLFDEYGGSVARMVATDLSDLREKLLSINGIGPETADSILLYAGQYPTFVVDAYTARIFKRHQWIEPEAGYDDIKDYFESRLAPDTRQFNEYHALIVRCGKEYCRKQPRCEQCPLRELLPDSGPACLDDI